jgi:hypothetical protein
LEVNARLVLLRQPWQGKRLDTVNGAFENKSAVLSEDEHEAKCMEKEVSSCSFGSNAARSYVYEGQHLLLLFHS